MLMSFLILALLFLSFAGFRLSRFVRHNVLLRYSDRKAMLLHEQPVDVHSPRLGLYYADFRRCMVDAIYDEKGVAVFDENGAPSYNPCAVSEAALLAYEDFLKTGNPAAKERFRRQLEWLSENATKTDIGSCFYYTYDTDQEVAPWGSGIAQGIAISALLRGSECFGNADYLNLARRVFLQLDAPVNQGGFRYESPDLGLWYEEDNHAGHIVNGHIYALLGVHDFYRVTGEPLFKERFDAGIDALAQSIPRFDLGFNTAYRLDVALPANNSYHLIHVTLFQVLASITQDLRFAAGAQRFRRYHDETWFRVRTTIRLLKIALDQRR
ncbi:MAG: D-glucuronyl C5-epimerase family protein [Vicinamibacteria bacterium]